MKNRIQIIFILIFSVLTLTNCNYEDKVLPCEIENKIWNLRNISGGFSGVNIDYEKGEVTWKFEPKTKKLIVNSSILNEGPQSVYLPLQGGQNSYSFLESNGVAFLKIDDFGIHSNGEYGHYLIDDHQIITIDQGKGAESSASDVFVLTFD